MSCKAGKGYILLRWSHVDVGFGLWTVFNDHELFLIYILPEGSVYIQIQRHYFQKYPIISHLKKFIAIYKRVFENLQHYALTFKLDNINGHPKWERWTNKMRRRTYLISVVHAYPTLYTCLHSHPCVRALSCVDVYVCVLLIWLSCYYPCWRKLSFFV